MLPDSLLFKMLVLLFLSLTGGFRAFAQNPDSDLKKEILHMDSVLFNGFNTHNLEVMKSVFDKDLEFYHDKGGLTNYDQNIAAFQQNFSRNQDIHRELIPGSTEIYPVKDFGAMQIGAHRFCHTENGQQDCGTFKFVHIWKKTPNGWKLVRVVSYGH